MESFIRILQQIAAVVIAVIGLGAMDDDLATWGEWWAKYHDWMGHLYVSLPLVLVAAAWFAWQWANILEKGRLKRKGGLTGKEFPASYERWDRVQNFTVWEVQWLWNGLEPQAPEVDMSVGTPAQPTFRRLSEHFDKRPVMQGAKPDDSWLHTKFTRQQLVDYALEIGERPGFLFVEERNTLRRLRNKYNRRKVPFKDATRVQRASDFRFNFMIAVGKENRDLVDQTILQMLCSGKARAIGRIEREGIAWDFERIPRRWWRAPSSSFRYFPRLEIKGRSFADFRIETVPEAHRKAQDKREGRG